MNYIWYIHTGTHTHTMCSHFSQSMIGPNKATGRSQKICHSTHWEGGTTIIRILSGFQPKQLQEAGFHLKDMMMAGYSFPEVLIAGDFPVQEVGPTVGYFIQPRGATSDSRRKKGSLGVGEAANRDFWWGTLFAVSTGKQVESEKTKYDIVIMWYSMFCILCMSTAWDFLQP